MENLGKELKDEKSLYSSNNLKSLEKDICQRSPWSVNMGTNYYIFKIRRTSCQSSNC